MAREKYGETLPEFKHENDLTRFHIMKAEDMAVFKYRWDDFLTDKEKSKRKDIPPPKEDLLKSVPKVIDMKKAVKIEYSAEEIQHILSEAIRK